MRDVRTKITPGDQAMRKLLIGAAIALPFFLVVVPASALPGAQHGAVIGQSLSSDVIEVKRGGRGWGRGHGWGRPHAFAPPGWSRGRKVGWRGMHCPPGHWKKGWC
jgi:hypothetical protein